MTDLKTFYLQGFIIGSAVVIGASFAANAAPVPSYVPPVSYDAVPDYADDTRGVFIPSHQQHRMLTEEEQQYIAQKMRRNLNSNAPDSESFYSEQNIPKHLNSVVGQTDYYSELDRIAADPGLLRNGSSSYPQHSMNAYDAIEPAAGPDEMAPQQYAQVQTSNNGLMVPQGYPQYMVAQPVQQMPMVPVPMAPVAPVAAMPNTMSPMMPAVPSAPAGNAYSIENGGVQLGGDNGRTVDMHNSRVSLNSDRITVRRALQRMMDQIGAGDWVLVWDLAEQNSALADMEISISAQEPFIKVLNALLARIQARSGQPLRVVRYDNTQRLVITDRAPGSTTALGGVSSVGAGGANEAIITENVLKESMVSIHYDEIPLIDALENLVNQAGKGQWRLRAYAGTDQVLKPAHIEEPFGIAIERLLKLFDLKYEIFPGGKLIVITTNDRFGFDGINK